MGGFNSFTIGASGLRSFNYYQEVIGSNISNLSNPAYKRREVILEPLHGNDQVYMGAKFAGAKRIVDYFLEKSVRSSISDFEKNNYLNNILPEIEDKISVLNENSIYSYLNLFWQALNDLSQNPSNISLRNILLNRATSLADKINSSINDYELLSQKIIQDARKSVDYINQKLKDIAILNKSIKDIETSGNEANSLKDKRDYIVEEISKYIDVDVYENIEGYVLDINGITLVYGDKNFDIEFEYTINPQKNIIYSIPSFGKDIKISNGILQGYQIAIKEVEEINLKIKSFLDFLTDSSNSSFNSIHRNGYNLDGLSSGLDFFVKNSKGEIKINESILLDPSSFAASKTPYEGDGDNCISMADFLKSGVIEGKNCFDYFSELSSDLGFKVNNAKNNLKISESIKVSAMNRRDSISGVSVDEEMMKLLEIQKYYSVMAKYINISNSMIEDLINIIR